jgi:hypothetical protein
VWVSDLAHLHELKRAAARALNEWQAAHPPSGVAHHQVDIFLIEPEPPLPRQPLPLQPMSQGSQSAGFPVVAPSRSAVNEGFRLDPARSTASK